MWNQLNQSPWRTSTGRDPERHTSCLSLQRTSGGAPHCPPDGNRQGTGCCPGLLLGLPLQPASHTATSGVLPRVPIGPVPPGSGPALCPHGQKGLHIPAAPSLARFVAVAPSRPRSGGHTSAPTHRSFPQLVFSLSHLANINSSFQTHLSCHLLSKASPHAP